MMGKEAMLDRIRSALRDVPEDEAPKAWPVPRQYRRHGVLREAPRLEQFMERIQDYRVSVTTTTSAGIAACAAERCGSRGVGRLVVPPDLPAGWFPAGLERLDDRSLSFQELDEAGAVMSGCALAISQTGTIVLDGGPGQGRRATTLLPDYHLCVVFASQVVELVPEALAGLRASAVAGRPLTFISGPSATSDIELNRVEGVHGPRTLDILLVLPEGET